MILILVLPLVAAIIFAIRNEWTYRTRMDILHRVSEAAHDDIINLRPFMWRYDAIDEVSYSKMVLTFWRKPISLYKDLSFTEKGTLPR